MRRQFLTKFRCEFCLGADKKEPPGERLFSEGDRSLRSPTRLTIGVLGTVPEVASRLMCGALQLVELAFSLQTRLAGKAANRIFDSALGFVRSALDMFLIHNFLLGLGEQHHRQ